MAKDSVPVITGINVNLLNPSLFKKIKIRTIDGEDRYDFTEDIIDMSKIQYEKDTVVLSSQFNARPDLLSLLLYGDANYADILCYVNGISNPFSIEEGMVLKIPQLPSITSAIASKKKNKNNNKAKDLLLQKLPQKDKDRLKQEVENGDIRTPNLVRDGSTPFVFNTDGTVTLGTGTTTKQCKTDLSQSQLISKKIREAVKASLTTA